MRLAFYVSGWFEQARRRRKQLRGVDWVWDGLGKCWPSPTTSPNNSNNSTASSRHRLTCLGVLLMIILAGIWHLTISDFPIYYYVSCRVASEKSLALKSAFAGTCQVPQPRGAGSVPGRCCSMPASVQRRAANMHADASARKRCKWQQRARPKCHVRDWDLLGFFGLFVGWFCLKIVEHCGSVEARKESSELCGEPAGVQLTHSGVGTWESCGKNLLRYRQALALRSRSSSSSGFALTPWDFKTQPCPLADAHGRVDQCGQGLEDLPSLWKVSTCLRDGEGSPPAVLLPRELQETSQEGSAVSVQGSTAALNATSRNHHCFAMTVSQAQVSQAADLAVETG